MYEAENYLLFTLILAMQLIGLISAAMARASIGSRHQVKFQWLFMLCLGLVGTEHGHLAGYCSRALDFVGGRVGDHGAGRDL